MTRPRLLALLLGLSALALVPGLASAAGSHRSWHRVVAFRSIAGIALGSSPAAVRRAFGPATREVRVGGHAAELDYGRLDLVFDFDPSVRGTPLDEITANARRYATLSGIRVGSRLSAVRRAYHGLACRRGICTVTRGRAGHYRSRTFTFVMAGDRVRALQISEDLDPPRPEALRVAGPDAG